MVACTSSMLHSRSTKWGKTLAGYKWNIPQFACTGELQESSFSAVRVVSFKAAEATVYGTHLRPELL